MKNQIYVINVQLTLETPTYKSPMLHTFIECPGDITARQIELEVNQWARKHVRVMRNSFSECDYRYTIYVCHEDGKLISTWISDIVSKEVDRGVNSYKYMFDKYIHLAFTVSVRNTRPSEKKLLTPQVHESHIWEQPKVTHTVLERNTCEQQLDEQIGPGSAQVCIPNWEWEE